MLKKTKLLIILTIIAIFTSFCSSKKIVKVPNKQYVIFKYTPNRTVTNVYLAGDFNSWRIDHPLYKMKKINGDYLIKVEKSKLKKGKNPYLFVVDGKWVSDPNAALHENRGIGGKVSIIIIN